MVAAAKTQGKMEEVEERRINFEKKGFREGVMQTTSLYKAQDLAMVRRDREAKKTSLRVFVDERRDQELMEEGKNAITYFHLPEVTYF